MEAKVDIILATYKTNLVYLKKQIDSILNQTFENIKLIISDDNSNNSSLRKILEEYSQKDKRVELYFQENNIGYIKNFEFLLSKTTAEYIMFSDHDDIWYPNKVEESLKEIESTGADLVYVNCKQINSDGKVIHKDYFKYKNMPLISGKSKLAMTRCIGIGCSQIFTKNIKEAMLPFTENVMAHDWLVSFIANENRGISYINTPLFGYRLHESNVFGGRNLTQNTNRWKKENGKTYKSYLKYRKEYVIDKAYLNGARMCLDYCKIEKNKEFLKKAIEYYEDLEKSKYINFHIFKYFKVLGSINLLKKEIKEIVIFHLPILGYLIFRR